MTDCYVPPGGARHAGGVILYREAFMKKNIILFGMMFLIFGIAFAQTSPVTAEIANAGKLTVRISNNTSETKTVVITGGIATRYGSGQRFHEYQMTVTLGPRERNKIVAFNDPAQSDRLTSTLTRVKIRSVN